jgi:hypothetical protein
MTQHSTLVIHLYRMEWFQSRNIELPLNVERSMGTEYEASTKQGAIFRGLGTVTSALAVAIGQRFQRGRQRQMEE